jgi:hypothetical protein
MPIPVNVYLVRLRHPGAPAAMARLKREFPGVVLPVVPPPEVREVQGVNDLPLALASVLTLLAAGTIAHILVTSVRRRRRDLAILKAVGFVGRQVRASVAWQATAIAGVGLLAGLPLGVAAGRWAWTALAQALAIEPVPIISPGLLLAVPAVLMLANAVAAIPANRGADPARRGAQGRIAVPSPPGGLGRLAQDPGLDTGRSAAAPARRPHPPGRRPPRPAVLQARRPPSASSIDHGSAGPSRSACCWPGDLSGF